MGLLRQNVSVSHVVSVLFLWQSCHVCKPSMVHIPCDYFGYGQVEIEHNVQYYFHVPPGCHSVVNHNQVVWWLHFYRRLWSSDRSSRHYANVGKLISIFFGVIMIGTATVIHIMRARGAVEDLQTVLLSIFGGGLLSLFLLGFLTRRVHSRPACIATCVTVLTVVIWLLVNSSLAETLIPSVSQLLPDNIWIGMFSNIILFSIAYGLSWLQKTDSPKDLTGLTIWTR